MRVVPSVADAVLYLAGWACGWFLLWRLPRVAAPRPDAPRRSLAVVVPARDEEANLAALLVSLAPQLRPGDELVVVDDHSTDATAAVASAGGARVVAAPELPEGWAGKPHACAVGASATTADVLVFVDADVQVAPGALAGLERAQAGRGGLVSVQPWHDVRRPYEHLSFLFNVTALGGGGAFSPLRDHTRSRIAYGPLMVVDRAGYDAVGGHGHEAVRGAVAEDLALARVVGRSTCFAGKALATFRMYPAGTRSLVQGWTKNIATGAATVPWWAGVAMVAWLWSLAGGLFGSVLFVAASVAQLWVQGRRVGRFGLVTALCYPVLLVFFLAVFLRSVALTAAGSQVLWRGRRVATRRR
jgi:4,4'-diaponeurosporenoate glycosyltransferase